MTKLINLQDHKKDDCRKYDLKDAYDNVLRFDLKPCPHCLGTIIYTRHRELHGPMGVVEGEEIVLSLCVKAKWYKPWEFFLPKKSLLLKRLAMIKKDIEWANHKHRKMEDLKKELN